MTFERAYGKPPGHRPESYWRPWLGDHVGVRPSDIADMNAGQLVESFRYVNRED